MKRYLYTPGPVMIPESTLLEMAQPIIHHRTPQFSAIFADTLKKLKWLFQTEYDVLVMASTGTGGMEASVTNFLSPGDKAIYINAGKFGERWDKIFRAYGIEGIELQAEWGQPIDVAEVRKALDANPDVKGVYVQASETSTGVAHPIEEIAKLTAEREQTILVVDAITALGAFDMPMDKWGIDVMISGSQKALMLPPGLSVVGVSQKAWKLNETAKCPHFYFDLATERKKHYKNDTTNFTSAVTLIIGLNHNLSLMQEEGLENLFARTLKMAAATRAGLEAIGVKLFAPDSPAPSVTSAWVPEGIDGKAFVKSMRDDLGVAVAGGQEPYKGKIFRVSHMGYLCEWDVYNALTAIEKGLSNFGYDVVMGTAAGAAAKVFNG